MSNSTDSGTQNLIIDTIAFYQDSDGNDFPEDVARKGGSQYQAASSLADLVTALEKIASGTISENSSFVAAGTGVNAFNRTYNGNDLYFAMFKPEKTPRWPGNLKRYKLAFIDDPANGLNRPFLCGGHGWAGVAFRCGQRRDRCRLADQRRSHRRSRRRIRGHTWTPPIAKHFLRDGFQVEDCSHTFGLLVRQLPTALMEYAGQRLINTADYLCPLTQSG